jgi:hypothetical protein
MDAIGGKKQGRVYIEGDMPISNSIRSIDY